jgi:multiple antibiotic resistance protein
MLFDVFKPYVIAFIPIFLAIDALGTVPLYLGLTEGLTRKQRSRILNESIVIASALAVVFVFLGRAILTGLGITIDDFRIAGGILLFIISVYLILPGKSRSPFADLHSEDLGIFPLATPLITGPAVIVTSMMLMDNFGRIVTLTALLANMGLTWTVLRVSTRLTAVVGKPGMKAFSKISYVFLAAIAIMIAREGVQNTVAAFHLRMGT